MAVQRKCSTCSTWNNEEDNCISCGRLLNPRLIEEAREKEREQRRNSVPETGLDRFIENWKNSRFLILRILYNVLYTVGFIFVAIASFFAWLAASPNG